MTISQVKCSVKVPILIRCKNFALIICIVRVCSGVVTLIINIIIKVISRRITDINTIYIAIVLEVYIVNRALVIDRQLIHKIVRFCCWDSISISTNTDSWVGIGAIFDYCPLPIAKSFNIWCLSVSQRISKSVNSGILVVSARILLYIWSASVNISRFGF